MIVNTLEQRWEILRHYFANHVNVAECLRKLRTDIGRRQAPSASYVRYLIKEVEETGILIDKPKHEKPKTVRTPENIAAVAKSMREEPLTSIYRRSQQLNLSETLLRRTLHKDLGMTPNKVQLIQELKLIGHPIRCCFAKWTCDRLIADADFSKQKSSLQTKIILILAGM